MGHRFSIIVPGLPAYMSLGFLGFCNVTLIEADSRYLIFDPGHFGNREYLLRGLGSIGLRMDDVDYVILSHLHYDHALNSLLFKRAKVVLSRREREYALSQVNDPYVADFLLKLLDERLILVNEGDEMLGIRFIELPGHTGGSMGALLDDGTALVGDAIKYIDDAVKGRTSFAYYNINTANESILKVLRVAKTVIPGHDTPFQTSNGKVKPIEGQRKVVMYLKGNVDVDILRV
jgi:glyoxylase-like metal-dependent hydrolase (beta-lactamase superfamily II)